MNRCPEQKTSRRGDKPVNVTNCPEAIGISYSLCIPSKADSNKNEGIDDDSMSQYWLQDKQLEEKLELAMKDHEYGNMGTATMSGHNFKKIFKMCIIQ